MTKLPSIALAQINPVMGALGDNAEKICSYWQKADAAGAELVVFPELCLCGYPPEDLVLKPFFLDQTEAHLNTLLEPSKTFGAAALIGLPWREDGKIYNAAFLIENGEVTSKVFKHHLPNYGVFDERRVFQSAPFSDPVDFRGHRLGIMICEDLWYDDVAAHLKAQGAEILIVPNGSPFEADKGGIRKEYARSRAIETGLPVLYVNQVGGQDELVFDGASFALDGHGDLALQLSGFTEQLHVYHDGMSPEKGFAAADVQAEVYQALKLGIHDYVVKNNFPGVLIGLSGGVDSALTAVLAVDALGADKVHCVMMPSRFTSQDSLDDAKALAHNLGVRLDSISIEEPLEAFERSIPHLTGLAHENIQSRIRGNILMALSNSGGFMVLSTGNKSEMAAGYATLYGDMNGGFNALKDVYKTQVYALCDWRNARSAVIPERIMTRAPSAELREDQTDQDSLPDYDVLDGILKCLIEDDIGLEAIARRGYDQALVQKVWRMLDRSEYKRRQACPGVKITSKAFGRDRRYPITNHFVNIIDK